MVLKGAWFNGCYEAATEPSLVCFTTHWSPSFDRQSIAGLIPEPSSHHSWRYVSVLLSALWSQALQWRERSSRNKSLISPQDLSLVLLSILSIEGGARFVLAQYGDYWRCMTKLLAIPQLEKFTDIREEEKLKLVESVAKCCREGLPCDLSSHPRELHKQRHLQDGDEHEVFWY